jgi:hypothetical protein
LPYAGTSYTCKLTWNARSMLAGVPVTRSSGAFGVNPYVAR